MATVAVAVIFGVLSLVGLTEFVGIYYIAANYGAPLGAAAHIRAWLGLAAAVLASLTVYQRLRSEPSRTLASFALFTVLAYALARIAPR